MTRVLFWFFLLLISLFLLGVFVSIGEARGVALLALMHIMLFYGNLYLSMEKDPVLKQIIDSYRKSNEHYEEVIEGYEKLIQLSDNIRHKQDRLIELKNQTINSYEENI